MHDGLYLLPAYRAFFEVLLLALHAKDSVSARDTNCSNFVAEAHFTQAFVQIHHLLWLLHTHVLIASRHWGLRMPDWDSLGSAAKLILHLHLTLHTIAVSAVFGSVAHLDVGLGIHHVLLQVAWHLNGGSLATATHSRIHTWVVVVILHLLLLLLLGTTSK